MPRFELTAVVAMSDDGGSSGRLRRTRGLPPPGDIRNCLVALASPEVAMREIFQYRFGGGGRARGIEGHAVGNLVIAALAELKGDFLEAVRQSAALLDARGVVLPSTLEPVQLVAQLSDARRVVGERKLARSGGRVMRVSLRPSRPLPTPGLLEAIARADLIALGPGSLYSSVMPNLLVAEVARALRVSPALKVMVANLMTEPGETDGMSCADHVRAVIDHAGPIVDLVLYNRMAPPRELAARYARKGAHVVRTDREALSELGLIPVGADLLRSGPRIRHDPGKLARILLRLTRARL